MRWLPRIFRHREFYFHEDDYCLQQFLPTEGDHFGVEIHTLRITRGQIGAALAPLLPRFDVVYTGYGSHRERCTRTAAWGKSERCALLADWDHDEIIRHAWGTFLDQREEGILTATSVAAALSKLRPMVYVDWTCGYKCAASDSDSFASLLRNKLTEIAEYAGSTKKG